MSIYNVSKRSLVLKESPLSIGWQQGTVFRAPAISFTWNDLSGIRADELAVKHRKTKAGERFVLITQDCDITASEKLEPYVEALLCRIEKNQEFLSKADRNSA